VRAPDSLQCRLPRRRGRNYAKNLSGNKGNFDHRTRRGTRSREPWKGREDARWQGSTGALPVNEIAGSRRDKDLQQYVKHLTPLARTTDNHLSKRLIAFNGIVRNFF
jgi:hypothetical protein